MWVTSINFKIVSPEDAVVPVMDRSFLYGDSVYETIQAYGGKTPFLIDRHYARLCRSAAAINMEVPFGLGELSSHLQECLKKRASNQNAYVRVVVSRGTDIRFSLLPHDSIKRTTVVYVGDLPEIPKAFYDEGIKVSLVSVRRNHRSAIDPNIKTGNYINNMMAFMEATESGAQDAIMLNQEGMITEATTSNVFLVCKGMVLTPEVKSGLLEGVSRGLVKEIIKGESIPFQERKISQDEFLSADEVFLTSTLKEVMPVTKIDDFKVGSGKPGAITCRLMKKFRKEVETRVSNAL